MINFNLLAPPISKGVVRLAVFAVWMVLLPGCYTVQLYHDLDRLHPQPDAETSDLAVVGGMLRLAPPVALRELCPSGVSKLEVQQAPTDVLVQTVTLGALHRQTVRAWCKRRRR